MCKSNKLNIPQLIFAVAILINPVWSAYLAPTYPITNCLRVPFERDSTSFRSDTLSFKKENIEESDSKNKWNIVSLDKGIRLDGKKLYCYPNSKLVLLNDSVLKLHVNQPQSFSKNFPMFSAGVGISFNASFQFGDNELGRLINETIDTTDAFIQQVQFSLHYDISLFRSLGFKLNRGLGGAVYVSGKQNNPDKINLAYSENSFGPYLELHPKMLFPRLPNISFRYTYLWVSSNLELKDQKMIESLTGNLGSNDVLVGLSGNSSEYSIVYGEQAFVMGSVLFSDLNYQEKSVYKGTNFKIELGLRI